MPLSSERAESATTSGCATHDLQKSGALRSEARQVVAHDLIVEHANALERKLACETIARFARVVAVSHALKTALEALFFVTRFLRRNAIEANRKIVQMLHRVVPQGGAVSVPALILAHDEQSDETEGLVTDSRDAADDLAIQLRTKKTVVVCGIEWRRIVHAGIPTFGCGKIQTNADLVSSERPDC